MKTQLPVVHLICPNHIFQMVSGCFLFRGDETTDTYDKKLIIADHAKENFKLFPCLKFVQKHKIRINNCPNSEPS